MAYRALLLVLLLPGVASGEAKGGGNSSNAPPNAPMPPSVPPAPPRDINGTFEGYIALYPLTFACDPSLGYLYIDGTQYSVPSLITCTPANATNATNASSGAGRRLESVTIGDDGVPEGGAKDTFNDVGNTEKDPDATVLGTTCPAGYECFPAEIGKPCG